MIFNNDIMTQSITQKHLEMFLDTKLDFQEDLKSIFSKVNKTIGLLRKLHHILPKSRLLQFVSPLLDLISTMVISYMMKHVMLHFTKN